MPKPAPKQKARVIKKTSEDKTREVKVTEHSTDDGLSAQWQDRFVKRVYEDPTQLLAHELNWKVHPRYQQAAMEGALDETGWLDEIKVDINSGKVFNGHMRVEIAISRNERVPVSYYDLTPQELDKALASFDALSELAIKEKEKYSNLADRADVQTASLQALIDHTAGRKSIYAAEATKFLDGYTGQGEAGVVDSSKLGGSSTTPAPGSSAGTAGGPGASVYPEPQGQAASSTTEAAGVVSVDGAASSPDSANLIKVLFLFGVEDKKELFLILNSIKDSVGVETQTEALMHAVRYYAEMHQEDDEDLQ